MKTSLQSNKFTAAGKVFRHPHRTFDRFRAAIAKKCLLHLLTRNDFCHLLSEVGNWFGVINIRTIVDQFIELLFNRCNYFRVAMAGIHDRNTGETVDILLSFWIRKHVTLSLINNNRLEFLDERQSYVFFITRFDLVRRLWFLGCHGGILVMPQLM